MSSFMADLGGTAVDKTIKVGNHEVKIAKKGSNLDLEMTDFIQLMIAQLTNQGIDDTMDTSEMLNQMVQMQMISSMVNMTDAVTTNYAASLVGKEVTVGQYGDDGKLNEIVGTVQATGTMDGQQVVFVNDKYYYLSEIMAIGRLPEQKEEDGEKVEAGDKTEGADKPAGTEKPAETEEPGETVPTESVESGSETEPSEYNGENGTPENGWE